MTVFLEWYRNMILNEPESIFPWYFVQVMPVTELVITIGLDDLCTRWVLWWRRPIALSLVPVGSAVWGVTTGTR